MHDLFNDIDFVRRRIVEQTVYIHALVSRTDITPDRFNELYKSASAVLERFARQELKIISK